MNSLEANKTTKQEVLRIIRSENIGPKTFLDLLYLYKTPKKILEAIPHLASRGKYYKKINICSEVEATLELEQLYSLGGDIITILEDSFPKLLKKIHSPPITLSFIGNKDLFNKHNKIAIVGSRYASLNGSRIAYKFAKELGELNYTIVSGLARGIDSSAHQGSLESGTIAVVAGGIKNIYPPENKDLYEQIKQQGLLVSEYHLNSAPKNINFPQRNRIISGLSLGTLIVEANLKSGSLITANYALEQNREVFAIPGNPLEARSQGANKLIKDGATLVDSISDITNTLNNHYKNYELNDSEENHISSSDKEISDNELNIARKELHKFLNYDPISFDEIINFTGLPFRIIVTLILELELAGKLARHPGNKVSLILEKV